MAGLSATSGGGFDYIQSAEPADPKNAELWFDTDGGTDRNGEVKVYDGSQWDTTGYVSHDQLTNVSPGDHHDPVTVSSPLTRSGQALALALGNALTLDSNDDLAVAEGNISLSNLSGYPIGTGDLGFDTATQSELDSHAGDTGNPHNVTDDQTGAATALSNHASDSTAHHSKPTQTQSASADAPTVTVSENISEGSTQTVTVWTAATSVDVSTAHTVDATVEGSTQTHGSVSVSDGTQTVQVDGIISEITVEMTATSGGLLSGNVDLTISLPTGPGHSHQI
ncbi:unknown [Haloarcula marismortui ATCC 43049]|uniref:Uncharacterized protein n=1 Tax=Haloarcula marismortui (strain ATCC 43049 / DSM 3752 / JCM 8966 / VKM B-1809) TaxID=272569 RepID=Q5V4E4_HALMA|nr:hypothetical protein [Haloarcula marismortui]AAV45608.1 unknown [Haloarcula marismortui ATCC 43049]QCP90394.1 hypothetical protein E6P14_05795 [Haloarcula marismortui ATCC 43049]